MSSGLIKVCMLSPDDNSKAHQWLYEYLKGHHLLQFLCWTLYPACLCALSTSFAHSICPFFAGVLFRKEVMGTHYSVRDYCPCFFAASAITFRLLSVCSRDQAHMKQLITSLLECTSWYTVSQNVSVLLEPAENILACMEPTWQKFTAKGKKMVKKLANVQIKQFVIPAGVVLERTETLASLQHILNDSADGQFPVVDSHVSPILLGTINKSQLRERLHQHRNEGLCKQLEEACSIQPVRPQLTPESTVKQAH
ncbi:hypothetical protein cypCar_00021809 [Cyprinus carpio]|nr:hypothetical protein cypCar_00021809 [Cyprinus carpio]